LCSERKIYEEDGTLTKIVIKRFRIFSISACVFYSHCFKLYFIGYHGKLHSRIKLSENRLEGKLLFKVKMLGGKLHVLRVNVVCRRESSILESSLSKNRLEGKLHVRELIRWRESSESEYVLGKAPYVSENRLEGKLHVQESICWRESSMF